MAAPTQITGDMDIEDLILKLHDIGGIKFGSFILKTGVESPVYFDLRVIVSHPLLMEAVEAAMWKVMEESGCKFESVCGVPYTALPIATCISVKHNIPMLIRRKEAKDYGTKRMIEGQYKEGERCLIIEDVVTSGTSVIETVQCLDKESIVVNDAIVLLDREQGGSKVLQKKGIQLHSVCTLSKVLDVLQSKGKLDDDLAERSRKFIADNRFDIEKPPLPTQDMKNGQILKRQSHKEREEGCSHSLLSRLYKIMNTKETNLCVSVDCTSTREVLQIVEKVGPHVCIVKTHVDIIEDFTTEFTQKLEVLANKYNFLIFEDRKFADIGNTVKSQYESGIYRISTWAHIVNAHPIPGPGLITGLKQVGKQKGRGCLLVAEMSSTGSLATGDYTQAAVKMAEDNKDFVMGFICQSRLSESHDFIHMTPGVKIQSGGDNLGQQYVTPETAICHRGADVIIVGRGITEATDMETAAQEYKQAGYNAYLQTLS